MIDAATSVRIGVEARGNHDGARLTGRAVDLTDALTFRAPFPDGARDQLPADQQWLLAGLDEVFDLV